MSDRTYTPGPWSVPHFAMSDEDWDKVPPLLDGKGKGRCNCKYVLCDDYMGAIATVHVAEGENEGDDPPAEEAKANARLIAAAPELYEALKGLVERRERVCRELGQTHRMNGTDGRYARARAAIAKAEGKA